MVNIPSVAVHTQPLSASVYLGPSLPASFPFKMQKPFRCTSQHHLGHYYFLDPFLPRSAVWSQYFKISSLILKHPTKAKFRTELLLSTVQGDLSMVWLVGRIEKDLLQYPLSVSICLSLHFLLLILPSDSNPEDLFSSSVGQGPRRTRKFWAGIWPLFRGNEGSSLALFWV